MNRGSSRLAGLLLHRFMLRLMLVALVAGIVPEMISVPTEAATTFVRGGDLFPQYATSTNGPSPCNSPTDKAMCGRGATPAGILLNNTSGVTGTACAPGDILIAGGWAGGSLSDPSNYLTDTECYSPAATTGTTTYIAANMVAPLGQVTQTSVSGTAVQRANMNYSRRAHTLVALPSGHGCKDLAGNTITGTVMAAGGWAGTAATIRDSTEIYNASMDKWQIAYTASSTAGTPILATMTVARTSHATVKLNNGTFLAVGGTTNVSGSTAPAKSSEIFDPTACKWSNNVLMSFSHGSAAAKFTAGSAAGGVLTCGGGRDASVPGGLVDHPHCELSNATGTVWNTTGDMTSPRSIHKSITLSDGSTILQVSGEVTFPFVSGGTSEQCTASSASAATCGQNLLTMPLRGTADITDGTAVPARTIPALASNAANALLLQGGSHAGQVLFCGGYTSLVGPATNGCAYYTTSTGWAAGPTMNDSRADFVMIELTASNRAFVAGGFYSQDVFSDQLSRHTAEFFDLS